MKKFTILVSALLLTTASLAYTGEIEDSQKANTELIVPVLIRQGVVISDEGFGLFVFVDVQNGQETTINDNVLMLDLQIGDQLLIMYMTMPNGTEVVKYLKH